MGGIANKESKAESNAANLLLLCATAGMMDGLSHARAHVFTANMTGNLVLLGIDLAQGKLPDAMRSLFTLAAFAVGCLLGGLVVAKKEELGEPIMVLGSAAELGCLLLFAVLFLLDRKFDSPEIENALIFSAAVALAVQSITVRRLKIAGVVTTFITGTITASMVAVMRILCKRPRLQNAQEENEEDYIAVLLGMLAVYLVAVVIGTLLSSQAPEIAAVTPAILLAIVLWRSWIHGR